MPNHCQVLIRAPSALITIPGKGKRLGMHTVLIDEIINSHVLKVVQGESEHKIPIPRNPVTGVELTYLIKRGPAIKPGIEKSSGSSQIFNQTSLVWIVAVDDGDFSIIQIRKNNGTTGHAHNRRVLEIFCDRGKNVFCIKIVCV